MSKVSHRLAESDNTNQPTVCPPPLTRPEGGAELIQQVVDSRCAPPASRPPLTPLAQAGPGGRDATATGRFQPMSDKDWALILESLNYTRKVFQEYPNYPSYDFRMEKLAEVDAVIGKVRQLRKGMR